MKIVPAIGLAMLSLCCASSQPLPRPTTVVTDVTFASLRNTEPARDPIVAGAVRRNVVVRSGNILCSGGVLRTGQVITASHCIDQTVDTLVDARPALVLRIGNPDSFTRDVALLGALTSVFPPLRNAAPYLDEPVFIVCNQLRFHATVLHGRISHVEEDRFLTDIVTVPGCSGGLVYSESGDFLGLHTTYVAAINRKKEIYEMIGGYQIRAEQIARFIEAK